MGARTSGERESPKFVALAAMLHQVLEDCR